MCLIYTPAINSELEWRVPPRKLQQNCKRGEPEQFGLIRVELRVFSMFSRRAGGGFVPIFGGDCTLSSLPSMVR